jgi:hypothetical protein
MKLWPQTKGKKFFLPSLLLLDMGSRSEMQKNLGPGNISDPQPTLLETMQCWLQIHCNFVRDGK